MIFITVETVGTVCCYRTLLTCTGFADPTFMWSYSVLCICTQKLFSSTPSYSQEENYATIYFSPRSVPSEPQGNTQNKAACLSDVQPWKEKQNRDTTNVETTVIAHLRSISVRCHWVIAPMQWCFTSTKYMGTSAIPWTKPSSPAVSLALFNLMKKSYCGFYFLHSFRLLIKEARLLLYTLYSHYFMQKFCEDFPVTAVLKLERAF